MIFQAKLRMKSIKVKPISPVVFGNIAKTLFEILPEEEAKNQIYKLVEWGTLFSDILPYDTLMKEITEIAINYLEDNDLLAVLEGSSLEEKKQKYKKWRSKPMPFIKESSVETIRRRTVVDRKSGVAAEGILFNDAERWYNQDAIYCLYVAVESERAIPLLELVLRIIEQTGFGTDISTGAGQIEFLRQNGKILTRNLEMERIFDGSCGNMSINIASTVLIEDIFKGNEFLRYCIERYDSRNPQLVKPP